MSETTLENPYDWRARHPSEPLTHPLSEELCKGLRRGELYALIGGHGMGKTVLLTQVEAELADSDSPSHVVFFRLKPTLDYTALPFLDVYAREQGRQAPPPVPARVSAADYVRALASRLSPDTLGSWSLVDLIAKWFEDNRDRSLVLLLDEIDQYVEESSSAARDFLNALASANSDFPRRFGVAIAGGLGVYELGASRLGSNFLSRAKNKILQPFSAEQIAELAKHFEQNGRLLSDETLDTLRLLSGGIPALVVYGLQRLWEQQDPEPDTVADIFDEFRDEHHEFEASVRRSLGLERDSGRKVHGLWRCFTSKPGPYQRTELQESSDFSGDELREGLRLLQASGLIRVHSRMHAPVIEAEPIQSILWPDEPVGQLRESRVEQLRDDLRRILARIGLVGLDFFKGRNSDGLVPEAVFSATLAVALLEAGWQRAHRESQQGPGRADLKLTHASFPGAPDAVVEVKIWPRNDYKQVHDQVTGYCIDGPAEEQCAAVVMLASFDKVEGWPDKYKRECLPEPEHEVRPVEVASPITAQYLATRKAGDGAGIEVAHYLLNLPRRRR
ncbi:ATP-binding protein [Haliangium sp.]|uniref:ATP-binding protein n=1 Tax=Haliangium sp. TaxID=2663208 RepID=UPI003D0D8F05